MEQLCEFGVIILASNSRSDESKHGGRDAPRRPALSRASRSVFARCSTSKPSAKWRCTSSSSRANGDDAHLFLRIREGDEQADRTRLGLLTKLLDVRRTHVVGQGDHRRAVVPRVGLHRARRKPERIALEHGERPAAVAHMVVLFGAVVEIGPPRRRRPSRPVRPVRARPRCDLVRPTSACRGKSRTAERAPRSPQGRQWRPMLDHHVVMNGTVPTDLFGRPSMLPERHAWAYVTRLMNPCADAINRQVYMLIMHVG